VTIAIIAGGRDYHLGPKERRWLDGINAAKTITMVVSGGAPGADTGGEVWADRRKIEVNRFPADWKKHGKAAGPLRNEAMLEWVRDERARRGHRAPSLLILFPGGKGTANIRALAMSEEFIDHVRVIEYKDLEQE
jgi:hypothetical protein